MATFEEIGLAQQIVRNLTGLRQNIIENARSYKAALAAGRDVSVVAAGALADAQQYLRRLQWVMDAVSDSAAKVRAGLSALSLSEAEARSLFTEMRDVAVFQRDAPKTSAAELIAISDVVLSRLPPYRTLW